jgi:hypothetical protein
MKRKRPIDIAQVGNAFQVADVFRRMPPGWHKLDEATKRRLFDAYCQDLVALGRLAIVGYTPAGYAIYTGIDVEKWDARDVRGAGTLPTFEALLAPILKQQREGQSNDET